MDYAYTINGWIKGMNASTLNKFRDMGRDGNNGSSVPYAAANAGIHSLFAKDVVGYTIGYFDNDYNAIGVSSMEAAYTGTSFGSGSEDLYNGNIRHLVTSIEGLTTLGSVYSYDQLQRLKEMTAFYNSNSTNTWSGMSATSEYFNSYNYDANGNILNLQRNATTALGLYMDDFAYNYTTVGGNPSNRLDFVTDSGVDDGVADDIIDGQTTGNYVYDKLGQLIADDSESISAMTWRYGDKKLKKIERNDTDSPQVEFIYNPFGQRIVKIEKPRVSSAITADDQWVYTYYAYDANGQVMAIYDVDLPTSGAKTASWSESNIYGASRLGQIKPEKLIFYYYGEPNYNNGGIFKNWQGYRNYEINNYLGNVNAVINDRKLWNATDTLYEATILTTSDFYPGGMLMPGRHGGTTNARYLFNGMEQDPELKGNGNSYTTEFRQYDPRIGRWLSLDPLMAKYPGMSPYVAFNNNPIRFVDPKGLEGQDWIKNKKTKEMKWDPKVTGPENTPEGYEHMPTGMRYESTLNGKKVIVTLGEKTDTDKGWDFEYFNEGDRTPQATVEKLGGVTTMVETYEHGPVTNPEYQPNMLEGTTGNLNEFSKAYDSPGMMKIRRYAGNFAMGATLFAGGMAIAPFAGGGTGGFQMLGKGARYYHTTFGMKGGYYNMGIDLGLQKLSDPNGSINYYSLLGAGFLPGNSFSKIAIFEVSTTMVKVQSNYVGVVLPNSGTSGGFIFNTMMNSYGNSKWGTPFLGTYGKVSGALMQGEMKKDE
jgi:RHS repeat-associated protein